jgi:5-methylcytosine-specific restriction endonuclease McrA
VLRRPPPGGAPHVSPTLARLCPGCRRLRIVAGRRCLACQRAADRARDARRGSPASRGNDARYRRLRAAILARDGGICAWCRGPARTIDHLVPLARGGTADEANLVAACARCNSAQGAARRAIPPAGVEGQVPSGYPGR